MTEIKDNFFRNQLKINDLCLAPLAGISDAAFRTMCLREGAGLMTTEMISAKGLYYSNGMTKDLMYRTQEEVRTGVQIFGSEEKSLREAVRQYINPSSFAFVDINMGCPVRKVVSNGDGSALLRDPERAAEVARIVAEESALPVSVKIRLGVDDKNINCVEVACALEEAGAECITVHGRTAAQMYSGKADWEAIKRVVQSVSIPIIANGDVAGYDSYMQIKRLTGCEGVMIGRAALGNPFVFREIKTMDGGGEYDTPNNTERMEAARTHLKLLLSYKEEKIACREFRKHMAWYTKGMYDSAKIRGKINTVETAEEFEALINHIIYVNA